MSDDGQKTGKREGYVREDLNEYIDPLKESAEDITGSAGEFLRGLLAPEKDMSETERGSDGFGSTGGFGQKT